MLRRALGFLICACTSLSLQAQRSGPVALAPASAAQWQPVGPAQILSPLYGTLSGRVGSLALDPADASGNTLYVGALGGGIWKSTNAASSAPTFAPLSDSLTVWQSGATPSLSIGAITVQPGGNGVVLAGTGDANNAVDSHYGAGILRSSDGGATWSLIQNTQDGFNGGRANFSFIGEGFTGFAWSGVTPGLVVAAVGGSANTTNVSRLGGSVRGLFYSADAGATWQLATISDGATAVVQSNQTDFSAYEGNAATAVVWNSIRQRFYAAVRYHGYYDSPDGITWTRLAVQPGAIPALFCPTNPGLPASAQCPLYRGAIAVDALTGDTFALSVDAQNNDLGLWQDICNQTSGNCAAPVMFGSKLDTSALDASPANAQIIGGDYALTLATLHTSTDSLLFAGTQDLFRCSLTTGCTWRNTTNTMGCAAAGVAPAQHAIVSAGNTVFSATDGGLWRSADAVTQMGAPCSSDDAAHFQNLNVGFSGSLSEISSFAQDPADGAVLLASTGRNGIAATASAGSGEWAQLSTSPFSPVAIDQTTPSNWYAETSAGVNISRCTAGTACVSAGFPAPAVISSTQVAGDQAALNAPFLLDPVNQANILVGTCRLWRGAADGMGWSAVNAISTMFDGQQQPSCNGNSLVRSIATAGPSTASGSKVIYVGMASGGSATGHLFANYAADQATNATVWTDVALSPVANDTANAGRFNAAGFDVSSVTADSHDATGMTVYAAIAGFSGNGISAPLVYRSTDGGGHWQNITSNLPDSPANRLLVDAQDPNTVYIALDSGVYVTNAVTNCAQLAANCWSIYLSGLPAAPVTSLAQISMAGQSILRAGTLGRGVWQTAPSNVTNPGRIILSPSSLTFANQGVGTVSAAQIVTLINAGGAPVTVIALTVPTDFSSTTNCAAPLAPRASCTIQVSFAPTTAGVLAETLSVSDGVQPQTVSLTGTSAVIASMTVAPLSLNFPTTAIGVLSAWQSVNVTNTGGSALTGFTAAIAGDFQIPGGGTCTATIAANTVCTVNVVFAPTIVGPVAGTLTIAAAGASTQTVMLTGAGAIASMSVAPSSLSFDTTGVGATSASLTITVTNTGVVNLSRISAATSTSDFTVASGGTCTASLAANTSCTVRAAFSPGLAGARFASLAIAAAGVQPQNVALNGTGSDFSLSVIGAASATITAGKTAKYQISVTPAPGSIGSANLACSGLPAHTSCLIDTNPVSLTTPSTANISVVTQSTAAFRPASGGWLAFAIPLTLCFRRRARQKIAGALVVVLIAATLSLLTGCGAGIATLIGGASKGPPQPGTYSVIVTGTSAGISRSANLTLISDSRRSATMS